MFNDLFKSNYDSSMEIEHPDLKKLAGAVDAKLAQAELQREEIVRNLSPENERAFKEREKRWEH